MLRLLAVLEPKTGAEMTEFDSLSNRGEYFAAHYFAEQLAVDLRKEILARWAEREGDELDAAPPAQALRALRGAT